MIRNAADFGELVRRCRRQKKLTQRDLALVAGVGERFVIELEGGKPTCQLGKSLAVAAALGIELTDSKMRAGQQLEKADIPDVDVPDIEGWTP
ncbi:Helix-turn-helix transcriptional regulator (plasmid) [Rhodovastum atsumiense]|uniref:Helix-turn-helix transcriptional regulator n=1 Tax=Rhodovastum atsumiense TaxID=504468 RepID=A0A5M6IJ16_9PROT|nr:helix-turn-helix domain-containing protein [Rhodovastum atsumiense]KAA5608266.1 helix-turn-helix transcriptional regulator [Rhodovastum atsumiense]CAH2605677.1 Helix-turn-helix transcriptional regulator [Rhodovastum atsumiense]